MPESGAPGPDPMEGFEAIPEAAQDYVLLLNHGQGPGKAMRFGLKAVSRESASAGASAVAALLKAHWFALWDASTKKLVAYAEPYIQALAIGPAINKALKEMVFPGVQVVGENAERKFQEFRQEIKKRRGDKEAR